jgi:hypothetical protein
VHGYTLLGWPRRRSNWTRWQICFRDGRISVTNLILLWRSYSFVSHSMSCSLSSVLIVCATGRCEELSCPLLALKIFGNFSKYNLRLSLPAARQLLHSLHIEHPIDKTITAAALYRVYDLPPIAQDLVSCSMLVSACFKDNTKDSISVANALMPHLQTLLQRTQPMKVSENSTERALDKPRLWVKWSLKKIDKALLAQNEQTDWLRIWRSRSGHVGEAAEPHKL